VNKCLGLPRRDHATCKNGKLHIAKVFKYLCVYLLALGRAFNIHVKEGAATRTMNHLNLKYLSLKIMVMTLFRIKMNPPLS
jgi:hypothetical protein